MPKSGKKGQRHLLEWLDGSNRFGMCSKLVLGIVRVDPMHHLPNQLLLSSEIRRFLGQTPLWQRGPGVWQHLVSDSGENSIKKNMKKCRKNRNFDFLRFSSELFLRTSEPCFVPSRHAKHDFWVGYRSLSRHKPDKGSHNPDR